jgi:Zn-dependent peptidase ImmA (M78 family)/transcriptional regulator with XRE-family HTH domain
VNVISSQRLGERLGDARKRAGLTQAQLAERLGLARTTIVAIEKGERRPSNAELVKFAEVVGTGVHDLIREGLVRTEVSPRFRIGLTNREQPSVTQAVERLRILGGRYVELERLHGLHRARAPLETLQTYALEEGTPLNSDPRLEGEDAARVVRSMLGLGDEPAMNIDERFEAEAGLRIFYLDKLPAKLAAFLIWTDEFGACVAINRAHPVERQRWSLAHEVGHFLRDREGGDVLDQDDSLSQPGEVFPDAFAKEFLLPRTGVQKRFSERCRAGRFTPLDLHSLSRTFGVSFQAMALRLEELRLLPRGSYEKIVQSRLRPQGLGQPEELRPNRRIFRLGLPERYIALAVSSYDQELLSETEFAEVLATDVATARGVYQQNRQIQLDDGTELAVNFTGADLRIA